MTHYIYFHTRDGDYCRAWFCTRGCWHVDTHTGYRDNWILDTHLD